MTAQLEIAPGMAEIISLPQTQPVNRKHPQEKKKLTYRVEVQELDLGKDHVEFTMNDLANFSMTLTRPQSLGGMNTKSGSNKSTTPGYNLRGCYIVWQVPRAETSNFFLMFQNGEIDTMLKRYACYFGESSPVKPSDAIAGRVNSLKRDVKNHLNANMAPTKQNGNEASAYLIANNMRANFSAYVAPGQAYDDMIDCLFVSVAEEKTLLSVSGNQVSPRFVERALIEVYQNNGLLANRN